MATRIPDGEKPVMSVPVGAVPVRGRADKYQAIMRAARVVFGRDGYSRTSIDAIAAEAGVSSRTIYNHFDSKEQLFSAVLYASAAQVAEGFAARIERSGLSWTDPVGDLFAVGYAFAALRIDFPEHFAMVEQIIAEAHHFPPAMIEEAEDVGPRQVEREVVRRLELLAGNGLLHVRDLPRAALHFMAVVTAGLTTGRYGSAPLSEEQIAKTVRSGVDAFLNGYGAKAP